MAYNQFLSSFPKSDMVRKSWLGHPEVGG